MARSNFALGPLLQGFMRGQADKREREEQKKERDAKLKLFELQLAREQRAQKEQDKQLAAREKLFAQLGAPQANPIPPWAIDEAGAAGIPTQGQPASLTELLADPKAAMLLLQSGMANVGDLAGHQQRSQTQAMLQKLVGGMGAAGGMEVQGVKIGPDGQLMPDLGLPQVTTQTVETPDGPRIRTFETRSGRQVAELGAPKEERITPEQGGRIAALKQAQGIVPKLKTAFIGQDGKVNRGAVNAAWGNIPRSAGRKTRAQMEDALDAVIRARTGAAVTKEELEGTMRQFLPHPLDDDATVIDKLTRLEQFVGGAIDVTTLPADARGGKVIDFNSLPK